MSTPPYALAPVHFSFPALAAFAGRAPLGGKREVALAALQVARLVRDAQSPDFDPAARATRATASRSWLATTALTPPVRAALSSVAEASGAGGDGAANELRSALPLLAPYLDDQALAELARLAGDGFRNGAGSQGGETQQEVTTHPPAASGDTTVIRSVPPHARTS